MNGIGIEVIKIALNDAIKKEQLISEELSELPEQSKVRKLVTEQTHLLEGTLTLLNRIT
jgi:predicted homoserine dehydrogenase-like protein